MRKPKETKLVPVTKELLEQIKDEITPNPDYFIWAKVDAMAIVDESGIHLPETDWEKQKDVDYDLWRKKFSHENPYQGIIVAVGKGVKEKTGLEFGDIIYLNHRWVPYPIAHRGIVLQRGSISDYTVKLNKKPNLDLFFDYEIRPTVRTKIEAKESYNRTPTR